MGSGRPGERGSPAWDAGARLERVLLELEATLIGARSEREGPAGNSRAPRVPPLPAYLDRDQGKRSPPSGDPFNAGANTAAHDVHGVELTLEQSPREVVDSA